MSDKKSSKKIHTEWEKLNSLSTPGDYPDAKVDFDVNAEPLPQNAVKAAKEKLVDTTFSDFLRVERRYADPEIMGQKFCLISFVPAIGASPNEKGVYGFAKVRGVYGTLQEVNERCEYIIKNVDSYHKIFVATVGRPFPLTTSSEFSAESVQIDLQKEATKAISEDVKAKREKEQKEIEEIQEREKELLEDVKRDEEPSIDRYTTLHTKKAQLKWTYNETKKKMEAMCTLIAKTMKEIHDFDEKDGALKDQYKKKYLDARARAGLSNDKPDESFMKYLLNDISIPEVDAEYQKLYGSDI